MFSTSQGDVLGRYIAKYGIDCMICKDGTDIGLTRQPDWLISMTNVHPLNAYLIDSEKLNPSTVGAEYE